MTTTIPMLGAALLCAASGLSAGDTPAATPPDIIYILADELACFEPGFMGGKDLLTPNLDRLAAGGMVMRNLLSGGPCCAPARGALLTGKHSGHGSVRENSGQSSIRSDEATISSVLKARGYAIGGFGKWGIGGRDSEGVPERHGFDVFFGYYDQAHAHTYYPPYLIRNSEEVYLPGNKGGRNGQTYSQYRIHQEALGFIRTHAGKRPFFAYLPYTPPHGPFAIPEDDPANAPYQDKPWSKEAKLYAAMTTMLDRQVGEVLALVRELGGERNTLVFFSGDNGGTDRFADADHPRGLFGGNVDPRTGVGFRGGKGDLYEGALRVPFVASWPGRIAPGRVSAHLGYFPDVLPTIAEAVGAPLPAGLDGISFLPELIGEAAAGRPQHQHPCLYWEYNHKRAIRQGDWRAVKPGKGPAWELYQVATDPGESRNLADQEEERLRRMMAAAEQASEPVRKGTYATMERADRDHRKGAGDAHKAGGTEE